MNRIAQVLSIILILFAVSCYQPVSDDSGKFSERKPPVADSSSPLTQPGPSATADVQMNTGSSIKPMNDKPINASGKGFRENAALNLSRDNLSISTVVNESSVVEKRVFKEYGAVYLTKAKPPSKAMFTEESSVLAFQSSAGVSQETIAGFSIELQPPAMGALKKAIAEAQSSGLKITPRDGKEAGRRSYSKTLSLWKSRFEPALKHWKGKGRLTDDQIARLQALPITEQVAGVLDLEKQGIYFNTFFNNSILYSVAAPGTSQHLSMLAFDVNEFANSRIQKIMANHGWFRTVQNDDPHFTYLGYQESELTSIGLKKVNKNSGAFWIPDI
jgi:hypothetical protein